jgi:hypothetical protein
MGVARQVGRRWRWSGRLALLFHLLYDLGDDALYLLGSHGLDRL